MPTPAQVGKIWAAAKEIGLSEDALRDQVASVSGQRSIKAMSFRHARELIDVLVRLGARSGGDNSADPAGCSKPHGRARVEGVVYMATIEQRNLIDVFRRDLGNDFMRDEYFEGVCKRLIKKPRVVTASDAKRVIEMLKKRVEYENRRAKNG